MSTSSKANPLVATTAAKLKTWNKDSIITMTLNIGLMLQLDGFQVLGTWFGVKFTMPEIQRCSGNVKLKNEELNGSWKTAQSDRVPPGVPL